EQQPPRLTLFPYTTLFRSYASVEKEEGGHRGFAKGPTFLFVEVDDLKATMSAMKGAEVSMPERTTFYGSKEFGVKDPAGHIITRSKSTRLNSSHLGISYAV